MILWRDVENWVQKELSARKETVDRERILALQKEREPVTLPILYDATFQNKTIPQWTGQLEWGTQIYDPTARKIANNLAASFLREALAKEGKKQRLEDVTEKELVEILRGENRPSL